MKKIISTILVIMLICLSTTIYAANSSYSIELVSNKTEVKPGEEIEVVLKMKDLQNISGDGIFSFSAQISYDKDVFETLTDASFTPQEGWSAVTFNPENGKIVSDTSTGVKADSSIYKIKFKVKSAAKANATPKITITNFQASDGNNTITAKADATISLKVLGNSSNGQDNNGSNSSNAGSSSNGSKSNSSSSGISNSNSGNQSSSKVTNTSTTTTKARGSLPYAGKTEIVLAGIIILLVSGIVAYIKYRKAY